MPHTNYANDTDGVQRLRRGQRERMVVTVLSRREGEQQYADRHTTKQVDGRRALQGRGDGHAVEAASVQRPLCLAGHHLP